MIRLTREKALLLYRLMAEATGGSGGVRNEDMLDSALENAFSSWNGWELCPTKEEKAARLGSSLSSYHRFLDGNRGTGLFVMLAFLEMNGIPIQCTDEEIVAIGLALADGTMGYEQLLQWVRDHK